MNRQEEVFNKIAITFVRLIQKDQEIPYKREVLAGWEDFINHPGVKDNMIQAISNFLFDMDAQEEEKLQNQLRELLLLIPKVTTDPGGDTRRITETILNMLSSKTDEEDINDDEINADLSEVGGGDEDDTPLC